MPHLRMPRVEAQVESGDLSGSHVPPPAAPAPWPPLRFLSPTLTAFHSPGIPPRAAKPLPVLTLRPEWPLLPGSPDCLRVWFSLTSSLKPSLPLDGAHHKIKVVSLFFCLPTRLSGPRSQRQGLGLTDSSLGAQALALMQLAPPPTGPRAGWCGNTVWITVCMLEGRGRQKHRE